MSKKILFRADAAVHLGIGDLMSLIYLSNYFDNVDSYFIIKDYEAALKIATKYKLNFFVISKDISAQDEIDFINKIVNKYNIDMFVVEAFEIKLTEYAKIKTIPKVCINYYNYNNGDVLDNFDLVIDWDVFANRYYDVKKYKNTTFLLGAKYVLLSKEFYLEFDRSYNKNIKKVLISMGGADEYNITLMLVKTIVKLKLDIELTIILGAGYKNKKIIETMLKHTHIKYNIKQNVTNMLNEYLNCDVAITSGGLGASELIASKTPAILISTYTHQIDRCKYFAKKGFVIYLGHRYFDANELKKAIQNPIFPNSNFFFENRSIVDNINKMLRRKSAKNN